MTRTPRDDHAPATPPPAIAPGDDALHEALSAWMDGELDGDGQRFVLRRLGHDAALAARFERWQRVSLHLRGEAAGPVPADFAARVLRALEGDAPAQPTRAPRRTGWRWPAAGVAAAAALALLWPAGGPTPLPGDGLPGDAAPGLAVSAPEAAAPAHRGFDLDGLPEPVARPWPAASADTALGRALEGRMARHGGALTVGAAGAWQDLPAGAEAPVGPVSPGEAEAVPPGDGAPPR